LPSLGPRGQGWVVLQLLLLALVALAGAAGGGDWDGPFRWLTAAAGLSLIVLGVLLAGRGLLDLGRSLTAVPHPREGAELVETGVYARVRHPIYGGLIVASVGWGLMLASLLALAMALVLAVFFDLKSRREEAWLHSHYPGYAAYQGRSHRFIPWLY
jgi:protein-S-isoprenylcysteine O-methyltransferase Ste14